MLSKPAHDVAGGCVLDTELFASPVDAHPVFLDEIDQALPLFVAGLGVERTLLSA